MPIPFHLQGEDSVEYYLGLTPSGVIVLRNKTTVAHYYWPRIGKVFHKGKYFMLRVCDKNVSVGGPQRGMGNVTGSVQLTFLCLSILSLSRSFFLPLSPSRTR